MTSSLAGARRAFALCAMGCLASPGPAEAGPPFVTDDPEPTETGHWEVYAPLVEAEGQGADFEGSAGVELNYGALPGVQVTLGLPVDYAHDADGWTSGAGDIKLSVKYRFYQNERSGIQIAAFPGISIPTGSSRFTAGRVTALLPVWAQKDAGHWSVFGGGGYAINPGQGNRNYWTGGVALSRHFGERLLIGIEADRQGADTLDGAASTRLGLGGAYRLEKRLRLLASAGPTFEDDGGGAKFHAFFALGWDF